VVIDLTQSSPPMPTSATDLRAETPQASGVTFLPEKLPISITKLDRDDHRLLLKKQAWLKKCQVDIPRDMERNGFTEGIRATLIFGQKEAGTAVCISPDGLLLTCSHCVAESREDLVEPRTRWLVFASGRIVEATCTAWDPIRDLAILKITSAQAAPETETQEGIFPSVSLADTPPLLNARLVCVGHPGSEDLEATQPGIKTGYDVLHLSTGAFKGCAPRQDVQDNSEIGALMHSCWTYWGHSGAPLIERGSGRLVGLHSSWDDETGMRRGIALEAILEFLKANA
jgi:hypothetical protein